MPGFAINAPGTPAIAADFNGDGVLDLMGTDQLSGLGFVLLGKGNGNLVRQNQEFEMPPSTTVTVAADFNGDGELDLAMLDYGSPVWIALIKYRWRGRAVPLEDLGGEQTLSPRAGGLLRPFSTSFVTKSLLIL